MIFTCKTHTWLAFFKKGRGASDCKQKVNRQAHPSPRKEQTLNAHTSWKQTKKLKKKSKEKAFKNILKN